MLEVYFVIKQSDTRGAPGTEITGGNKGESGSQLITCVTRSNISILHPRPPVFT